MKECEHCKYLCIDSAETYFGDIPLVYCEEGYDVDCDYYYGWVGNCDDEENEN